MKKIIHSKSLLIATIAVIVFASGAVLFELRGNYIGGAEFITASTIENAQQTEAVPRRLIIRKIGVDTKIQSVGRTKAGAMDVPNNFYEAGWYNRGPRPGEEGSAVIAGHVDNALGLSGVFKHLDLLSEGDSVYVENASGTKMHFIVKRVAVYPYDKVPTQELFERKGGVYLNLITCGGMWIQKKKTYSERFVAYAELVVD